MNQSELEQFVSALPNVQREEAFGYAFYFVGDDHRLPFVTFAASDNDYDHVSNLSREGVFRINIGVSRNTFTGLVGHAPAADETIDYTALNVFLPHPDYARQNWVCILSPQGHQVEKTKELIAEAHAIATTRAQRQSPATSS